MPADHEDLEFNLEPSPEPEPVAVVGWQRGVSQTLARVAAERGIDFAPMPDGVAAVVTGLVDTVEGLAAGMDGRERQWLAAALAALSTHTQLA
jgi:hypothetical protein